MRRPRSHRRARQASPHRFSLRRRARRPCLPHAIRQSRGALPHRRREDARRVPPGLRGQRFREKAARLRHRRRQHCSRAIRAPGPGPSRMPAQLRATPRLMQRRRARHRSPRRGRHVPPRRRAQPRPRACGIPSRPARAPRALRRAFGHGPPPGKPRPGRGRTEG